jgi:hypothetical protein
MTVVSGKIEPKNGFFFYLKRLKQLKVEKFKVETDRCLALGGVQPVGGITPD